jgi:hypothetical protein
VRPRHLGLAALVCFAVAAGGTAFDVPSPTSTKSSGLRVAAVAASTPAQVRVSAPSKHTPTPTLAASTPAPPPSVSFSAVPMPVRTIERQRSRPDLGSRPWVAFPLGEGISVRSKPSPGANRVRYLSATNAFGQWLPLLALERERAHGTSWLRVRLPSQPNGSTGWVRADGVELRPLHDRIVVDLSERTLWRYHDGRLRQRLRVAIGSPATPTTPGRFYVWALVSYDDPYGPYGAYALGLNGFSEVLTEWPGGGRMAIHGTADPSDLGRAVSHGCIRVLNSQLRRLYDVPLGTPVALRP